jgi:hypothetical protein
LSSASTKPARGMRKSPYPVVVSHARCWSMWRQRHRLHMWVRVNTYRGWRGQRSPAASGNMTSSEGLPGTTCVWRTKPPHGQRPAACVHGGSAMDGGISRGESEDPAQGAVWWFPSVPGMGRVVRNHRTPSPVCPGSTGHASFSFCFFCPVLGPPLLRAAAYRCLL